MGMSADAHLYYGFHVMPPDDSDPDFDYEKAEEDFEALFETLYLIDGVSTHTVGYCELGIYETGFILAAEGIGLSVEWGAKSLDTREDLDVPDHCRSAVITAAVEQGLDMDELEMPRWWLVSSYG